MGEASHGAAGVILGDAVASWSREARAQQREPSRPHAASLMGSWESLSLHSPKFMFAFMFRGPGEEAF